MKFIQLTLGLALAICTSVAQAAPLEVIFPTRGQPERFDYDIGLLKLAMEKSGANYTLSFNDEKFNQNRILKLLADNEKLTVAAAGAKKEREEALKAVYIPLNRGLLGHRIFITNDPNTFANVKTLEDLKKITLGSGTGWPDTAILRSAGLNVLDAKYQGLFRMTSKGRVQGYGRGVNEPFTEVAARKADMPNLTVDSHVMVVYRFDTFFYVNKQNTALHTAIETGLKAAYADGTFMDYFQNHPRTQTMFQQAKMEDRIVFRIDNPLMTPKTAAIPPEYWEEIEGK